MLHVSSCCQIFTDFYEGDVRITSNISRWTLTGLKQLVFTWFSIKPCSNVSLHPIVHTIHPKLYVILVIFNIFRADRVDSMHIGMQGESQIWSSGFWGTFICSSLNHHWIALHYCTIRFHWFTFQASEFHHFSSIWISASAELVVRYNVLWIRALMHQIWCKTYNTHTHTHTHTHTYIYI